MEIQTRTAMHHNTVLTPSSGMDWFGQNRKTIVTAAVTLLVVLIVVVGGVMLYNARVAKAEEGFGQAMAIYETPLVTDAQQAAPGAKTFPTQADRAKAAYPQFAAVADQYAHTPAGHNALYMAGVTANESGQTATAEDKLKDASSSMDKDTASLAKLALANLYHQTNRDADAITLYNEMTQKPTTVVPAGLAQLQLAGLYESTGKVDAAKKIYAQLKDKDSKSVAGAIASQKLTGGAGQ